MIKKIQQLSLPVLITLSALSVSTSAAFYSVSGLSKLFAGASLAVIIMAASLEVSKLVIASLLYQYRKALPKGLKIYLTSALAVLVLITSMGIYGFLSAAYQDTASQLGSIEREVLLVETKRDNVKEQLAVYSAEKSSIDGAVTELRNGLSNNKIQYTNAEGQLITTQSSSTRRALEKQLDQARTRQTEINAKVDALNEQLFEYETEIVSLQNNDEVAGELGPLKYLSKLTDVGMDKIINMLLLVIIFVFDPLAISLVIAANFAFEQLKDKTKENIYGEKVYVEENEDYEYWSEDEMQDFNDQFNADDMLPDEDNMEELHEDLFGEEDEDLPNEALTSAAQNYKEQKEEDLVIIDEEPAEPQNEYNAEFDLDGDGKLSDEEYDLMVKKYRENRLIEDMKRKKQPKDDNDLTITY